MKFADKTEQEGEHAQPRMTGTRFKAKGKSGTVTAERKTPRGWIQFIYRYRIKRL